MRVVGAICGVHFEIGEHSYIGTHPSEIAFCVAVETILGVLYFFNYPVMQLFQLLNVRENRIIKVAQKRTKWYGKSTDNEAQVFKVGSLGAQKLVQAIIFVLCGGGPLDSFQFFFGLLLFPHELGDLVQWPDFLWLARRV